MHTFPSVYQLNKSGTASCYDKPFNAPDKVAQPRQTNPVVEAVQARTSVSGSSPKRPRQPQHQQRSKHPKPARRRQRNPQRYAQNDIHIPPGSICQTLTRVNPKPAVLPFAGKNGVDRLLHEWYKVKHRETVQYQA